MTQHWVAENRHASTIRTVFDGRWVSKYQRLACHMADKACY